MPEHTSVESNDVPFRDLPQEPGDKIVPTVTKKRPWMAHWPPRSGHNTSVWATSDSPSVLSWRYSPQQPFDRPWRSWTRTPLAKQEIASKEDKPFRTETPYLETHTVRLHLTIYRNLVKTWRNYTNYEFGLRSPNSLFSMMRHLPIVLPQISTKKVKRPR